MAPPHTWNRLRDRAAPRPLPPQHTQQQQTRQTNRKASPEARTTQPSAGGHPRPPVTLGQRGFYPSGSAAKMSVEADLGSSNPGCSRVSSPSLHADLVGGIGKGTSSSPEACWLALRSPCMWGPLGGGACARRFPCGIAALSPLMTGRLPSLRPGTCSGCLQGCSGARPEPGRTRCHRHRPPFPRGSCRASPALAPGGLEVSPR